MSVPPQPPPRLLLEFQEKYLGALSSQRVYVFIEQHPGVLGNSQKLQRRPIGMLALAGDPDFVAVFR